MGYKKKKDPKVNPNKLRPKKEIDWGLVIQLLKYQCTGTMIASRLGIHPDTLYDRVQIEHGKTWTGFSEYYHESGKSALLQRQFERALCAKRPSDNMLIWLGKQVLKQKDKQPEEIAHTSMQVTCIDMPVQSDESGLN